MNWRVRCNLDRTRRQSAQCCTILTLFLDFKPGESNSRDSFCFSVSNTLRWRAPQLMFPCLTRTVCAGVFSVHLLKPSWCFSQPWISPNCIWSETFRESLQDSFEMFDLFHYFDSFFGWHYLHYFLFSFHFHFHFSLDLFHNCLVVPRLLCWSGFNLISRFLNICNSWNNQSFDNAFIDKYKVVSIQSRLYAPNLFSRVICYRLHFYPHGH